MKSQQIFCLLLTLGISFPTTQADNLIPQQNYRILFKNSENGSFDLFYQTSNGVLIGCRGNFQNGNKQVSELFLEENGNQTYTKLRLFVLKSQEESLISYIASKVLPLKTIKDLGLDHFKLWPRECVDGMMQFDLKDFVSEVFIQDSSIGVANVDMYKVQEGQLRVPWWQLSPTLSQINLQNDESQQITLGDSSCNYVFLGTRDGMLKLSSSNKFKDDTFTLGGGGGGGGGDGDNNEGGDGGSAQGVAIETEGDIGTGFWVCNSDNVNIFIISSLEAVPPQIPGKAQKFNVNWENNQPKLVLLV